MPLDSNGKPTTNLDDTYIKGYKSEVYRYNDNTLAIQFMSNITARNMIPKLKELGIEIKRFVEGDNESVYFFFEEDIDKVDTLLNFKRKGAKKSPRSKSTIKYSLKLNKTKSR